MAEGNRPPLVAVLAAGSASRFGGGKLDAMLAGKPVGQYVLDAVAQAGLGHGLIVVPSNAPHFAENSGWPLITNINASDGLGTSLALAASAALAQSRALLVLLADMPLITASHIGDLLASGELAATIYPDGKAGVPAYFPVDTLEKLRLWTGEGGAGRFLNSQRQLRRIPAKEEWLVDVDRPVDIARAEEILSQRG